MIVGKIAREYMNKLIGDPKITVGSLVDDLKTMYGVEVDPQKVYRAKTKILKSTADGDRVKSFRQLWKYFQIIKQ